MNTITQGTFWAISLIGQMAGAPMLSSVRRPSKQIKTAVDTEAR